MNINSHPEPTSFDSTIDATPKPENPHSLTRITYKDIIDYWDLLTSSENDTILHALANVADYKIEPNRIYQRAKEWVIKRSLLVLNHMSFSTANINESQIKTLTKLADKNTDIVKNLLGTSLTKHIQQCLQTIREHDKPKHLFNKHIIQEISTVTGAFIPRKAVHPSTRKSIVTSIKRKLLRKIGSDSLNDKNSMYMIHLYLKKNIAPLSTLAENSNDPAEYFLNRHIDLDLRRKLFFHENYDTVYNWSCLPVTGSTQWCSTGKHCKVDLFPAKHSSPCTSCNKFAHKQCCYKLDGNSLTCNSCLPNIIHHWNYLSGGDVYINQNDNSLLQNTLNSSELIDQFNNTMANSNENDDSEIVSIQTAENQIMVDKIHKPSSLFENLNNSIVMFDDTPDCHTITHGINNQDSIMSERLIPSPNVSPITTLNTHTTITPPNLILNDTTLYQDKPNHTTRFNMENNTIQEIERQRFSTRMQLRIPLVIKEYDTQWTIPEKILSVIQKILVIDPTMTIIPWSTDLTSISNVTEEEQPPPVLNINEFLSYSVNDLKTYFNRINQLPKPIDNFSWVDFTIQHQVPIDDIKNGMAARLQKRGYSLYPRQLQSQKEIVIGWLLWSYREQDADLLARIINKKFGINTYLRWATINIGQNFTSNQTKALHIVSSDTDHLSSIKAYTELYKLGRQNFPLCMKMRFIPMANAVSPHLIEELQRSRTYQQGWLRSLEHSFSTDIITLDKSSSQMPTLREMISKLKSSKDSRELFQGVNKKWNDPSVYIFTYRKQLREEAKSRINTLLTFLQNTTGYINCHRYFSDQAQEAAKQQIWDAAIKDVIQAADLLVPVEAILADAEYLGLNNKATPDELESKHDNHAINVFLDKEKDSVKTFTSANASVNSINTTLSNSNNNSSDLAKHNNTNSVTTQELNNLTSTLIQIKKTISVLDANVKNTNQESEEILGKLIVLENMMSHKTIRCHKTTKLTRGQILHPRVRKHNSNTGYA